jgi:hypothetical protein
MPISLIQILLLVFFILATAKTLWRLQRRELPPIGFFWVLVWIAGAVVTLLPDSTFYFARLFGVQRGADLVVYLMLAALSYAVFRLVVQNERLKRDVTKLTRHLALSEESAPEKK